MQTENLFELTYILLEKKQVTAAEMAEHFGVSVRTIFRWVDALNLAGVPVYAVKGKGGGIRVSEKYALDKTVFTEEEKLDLLSSIQAFQTLSGNDATSAITKLKTLTNANADWIEIDFAPWNKKGIEVRNVFNLLKNTIVTKHQICFDYYSASGFSEQRVVDPWKIILKGQAWYLYGFCHYRKEPRFFKLSRMTNLKKLETEVQKHKEEFLETHPDRAEENPMLETCELLVAPELVSIIMDEYSVEVVEDVLFNRRNWKKITLKLPKMPYLINWFLSFGSDLVVLEPKEVAEQIKGEIGKMMENELRSIDFKH